MKKIIAILFLIVNLYANEKDFSALGYSEYKKGNYKKAIEFYVKDSKVSKENASQSNYKIGIIYEKLNDYSNAHKYLRLSANYYNVDALKELGLLYATGKGVKEDYHRAFHNWIIAYELIQLNPLSKKEDLDWLKNNFNVLYSKYKNKIQERVSDGYSLDMFFLGYMWDICVEGSPGKTKETKNMKFCDTSTGQKYFSNSMKQVKWSKYKFWEIEQRYAGLYKPAEKGEKENILGDKKKFMELSTPILKAYNELGENGFPLAYIKLSLNYISGDISSKDLQKAKKYIIKSYDSQIVDLSNDIWIKYKLANIN